MLKTEKLFLISTKQSHQKPAYIKPKHKTYIQLLGLDKPKKKLFIQSDNQNDDFLQKLLRQEEKDKKIRRTKSKGSKSTRKKKEQDNSNKNNAQQNSGAKINNKNIQNIHHKKRDNHENEQYNKNNQTPQSVSTQKQTDNKINGRKFKIQEQYNRVSGISMLEQKSPRQKQQQQQLLRQGALNVWKRMESARHEHKYPAQGHNQISCNSRTSGINNQIMIDEGNQVPYTINNGLKPQLNNNCTKSDKGFRLLKQKKYKEPFCKVEVDTDLNPQKQKVEHKFKQKLLQNFKAKILTTTQLLSMAGGSHSALNVKRRTQFVKQQSLFLTKKHQAIFMNNLRSQTLKKKSRVFPNNS